MELGFCGWVADDGHSNRGLWIAVRTSLQKIPNHSDKIGGVETFPGVNETAQVHVLRE